MLHLVLLLFLLLLMAFVFLWMLIVEEPQEKTTSPIHQHTAFEWAKIAGIKGANAKSTVAATLANFKVRNLMFSIERNNKVYWGLCGITEQELVEKIRANALRHKEQGMPDIEVVEL